jgi:hypothetical protein
MFAVCSGRLSGEDIERMVEEAKVMKAEDDIRVAKIEAKNQLEGVVYQLTELARSIGKTSVRGVGNCLSSCACKICVSRPPLVYSRPSLLFFWLILLALSSPPVCSWQLERSAKAARDWLESPVPRSAEEYHTRREQIESILSSYADS